MKADSEALLMVTPTLAPARRRRPFRVAAIVLLIGLSLAVVAVGGAAVWFYSAARAALPQLDGTLPVTGLGAPVTVIRDAQGVPHIRAASMHDLFLAFGYVTAQDRLWQMDMTRRYAAGEVSEVIGAEYRRHDRQQRILGLRQTAERAVQELSPRDRGYMEAYAAGVNAYIDTHQDRLPIEFRLLRYRPRPWTPTDTALIGANICEEMNFYQAYEKVWREQVSARIAPDLAADLYVNSSWRDHPPGQDGGEINAAPQNSSSRRQEGLRGEGAAETLPMSFPSDLANSPTDFLPGSNNWVVSGARTVSGKPLLSNDPHLGHEVPGVWYEAHLTSGDFDVAGVAFPGTPYIILGHNRRIAWGFTNIGPDVTDLFVENFNDKGEYQTPEGWRQPDHRREVIRVKGGPDVVLDVVTTRHGPIISDLLPGETRKLALRWTLYDPHGLSQPLFDVDAAQNWEEFRRAFSTFGGPSQNAVYADVDGHIGYQATGLVPVRAAGDGAVPVPGRDNAHEWTGYVPYDQLPRVFDPPSGILATANGRIAPDGYPYVIATEWGPPYRTERIYRVLQSGKKFAPADMPALQMDIYSDLDRFFADRFVYAVDHSRNASPRARQAAELMRGWDGRMSAGSAAPAIAATARYELVRLLLEPRLGAGNDDRAHPGGWEQYRWAMWPVWLETVVQRRSSKWLPANYSDYDQFLTAAVEAAVTRKDNPRNLSDWNWGQRNRLRLQHPILGAIPLLSRWTGRQVEQSGSGFCVKATTRAAGPSERTTVDLADLDHSTLNIVLGQSGNFLSPHYMDQFDAWSQGRTFPLPFSPAAVDKAKAHALLLQPK